MDFNPGMLLNVVKVGPIVIDFGKEHWKEIAGAIVLVLALYLGKRVIDRLLPPPRNDPKA